MTRISSGRRSRCCVVIVDEEYIEFDFIPKTHFIPITHAHFKLSRFSSVADELVTIFGENRKTIAHVPFAQCSATSLAAAALVETRVTHER